MYGRLCTPDSYVTLDANVDEDLSRGDELCCQVNEKQNI